MYNIGLFFWVRVPRDDVRRYKNGKNKIGATYILRLPPGSVVTFTNLYRLVRNRVHTDYFCVPAVVEHAFLGTTPWVFLLFLLFNLWRLRLDLTGTRKRTVN